jgi:uncharacterized protein YmfQ (DUF2313 family)
MSKYDEQEIQRLRAVNDKLRAEISASKEMFVEALTLLGDAEIQMYGLQYAEWRRSVYKLHEFYTAQILNKHE